MKKIVLLLIATSFTITATKACDICGCGVGNTYIGVLPEFRKHIFGVRYRYSSLVSHVGVGGTVTYLTTNEYYKTTELWGGFYVGKRLRLLTAIPYNFNERNNQGISSFKNGLGDINTTVYYELLNKKKTYKNKLLIHSLWFGGGIKLPTGQYNPIDKSNTNNNNLFQLGTGSVDFTINSMYDLRYQDAGLNINANYKINTSNKYKYLYGNKLTISSQAYYKFKIANKFSVVPNTGVLYETARQDYDDKTIENISGGNLTMGTLGLETAYKKIAFGINWQTPLNQNVANGIVKANDRVMVHMSILL
jgi:hypothetical protein